MKYKNLRENSVFRIKATRPNIHIGISLLSSGSYVLHMY